MRQIAQLFKDKIILVYQVFAAFILPIKPLIVLVGLMIVFDTISGIWKAKKKKEDITSRKLSRVVSKMLLYQVALITFYALDVYIFGEFIAIVTSIPHFMTKFVAIFFVSVEFLSITENIKEVTGFSVWDNLKKVFNRIKDVKDDIEEIK